MTLIVNSTIYFFFKVLNCLTQSWNNCRKENILYTFYRFSNFIWDFLSLQCCKCCKISVNNTNEIYKKFIKKELFGPKNISTLKEHFYLNSKEGAPSLIPDENRGMCEPYVGTVCKQYIGKNQCSDKSMEVLLFLKNLWHTDRPMTI